MTLTSEQKMVGGTILFSLILIVGGYFMVGGGQTTPKPQGKTLSVDVRKLCVEHGILGMHIHPQIVIKVKGEPQEIPANIGITKDCMRPIHTHDATGTMHLEFPKETDVKLSEFFKVWGKKYDWSKAKMRVNGVGNKQLQNYIMQDLDRIQLDFQ